MAKKFSPVRTAIGVVALAASLGALYYVSTIRPLSPEEEFARIDFISNGKKLEELTAKKGDNIYVYVSALNNYDIISRTLVINGRPSPLGVCCYQFSKRGRCYIEGDSEGSLIPTSQHFAPGKNLLEWILKDNKGREHKSNEITLDLTP